MMNGNIIRIPLSWSSIIPKKSFFESFDKFFAIENLVIDRPIPPGMYLFMFA